MTLVRWVQLWNTESLIVVTLLGIVTLVSGQLLNAESPMLVTVLGIVTLVRLKQNSNAIAAMLVSGRPLILAGMTTALNTRAR